MFSRFARSSLGAAFSARAISGVRLFASESRRSLPLRFGLPVVVAATVGGFSVVFAGDKKVDYDAIRQAVIDNLDQEAWDDGSIGPVLVRLAWHASGTYSKDGTGGSSGASMRFAPEAKWGANNGLEFARSFLEPIKEKYPQISYADLWVLAGTTAIEAMGGPKIPFRPGRTDVPDEKARPAIPDGRLPDASQGAKHIRDIFSRMGFDDREMVALIGAHCLGRCHKDRSGYDGPWTRAPTTFSNQFFVELLNNKWTIRKWDGPKQYTDPSGDLMMLPADMALIEDKEFRKYAELYAKDEEAFFKDFAKAWQKLVELGVKY